MRHKQKIKSGEATLRFYSQSLFFCLSRKDSFKCVGRWKLVDLPKYGAVESGFAFETTDTNSNDRKSMYLFETSKGKEIHQLFDSVCRAGEAGSAAATNQGNSIYVLFVSHLNVHVVCLPVCFSVSLVDRLLFLSIIKEQSIWPGKG